MPWVTATALGISISRDGFQLGDRDALSFDGPVLLLLGIVTIVIGVSRLTKTAVPRFLQRSSIVTGVAAALVLVNRYPGIHDLVNQVNSSDDLASIGYGFWVCAAGALAAFIGGLVLRSANRQATTELNDQGIISEAEFEAQRSRLPGSGTEPSTAVTELQTTPTDVERPTGPSVSPASTKLCPNGHEVSERAKFCPSCGEAVSEQSVIGQCPNGHDNRAEAQFCSTCGEAIAKGSPAVTGRIQ
jgi:hypothetical protein